jgi:hypothetical protein
MEEDQPQIGPEEPPALLWAGVRTIVLLTMAMGGMLLFMGTLIGFSLDPEWRRPPALISACLAVLVLHEVAGAVFLAWSKGRDHGWW